MGGPDLSSNWPAEPRYDRRCTRLHAWPRPMGPARAGPVVLLNRITEQYLLCHHDASRATVCLTRTAACRAR